MDQRLGHNRATRWLLWALVALGFVLATPLALAVTILVFNTNDGGPGSLRDAIDQVNRAEGTVQHSIVFGIPGPGPHTIAPRSLLPPVRVPVLIDGYTQPGASPNTDAKAHNAVLKIVIDGGETDENRFGAGLTIGATDSTVRGVVIVRYFVGISLTGGGRHRVAGSFIGMDAAGTEARLNVTGVAIAEGASDCMIGGADPASRNLISGNLREGISIFGANRNRIEGNLIGPDKTGRSPPPLASQGIGILARKATGTIIGGASAGQRNVISGNRVGIQSRGGSEQSILGNYIGTDIDGTASLRNTYNGVVLSVETMGERNTVIGGTSAGAANVIAFNGKSGIAVQGADSIGNTFRGNRIFSNERLGIDLGNDGVTANDPSPDADQRENRSQNFPILVGVEASGTGIKISGILESVPDTSYYIDFYSNEARDPSGHGEGQFYLGFIERKTDATGKVAFDATFPAQGTWISATATRIGEFPDTSEFSPAIPRIGSEFGVNTTNPTGTGSFAQAIQDSNATADEFAINTIRFDLPPGSVINVASTLNVTRPVQILGCSQTPAAPPTPCIGLDGAAVAGGPVINVLADNSTIRGLAFLRHQPTGTVAALQVSGNGNWISGNTFGITPGNMVIANKAGVAVFGEGNRIGGPAATDRNVASGNSTAGIVLGAGAKRNLVQGNLIGTDSTGTQNRGNGDTGVLLQSPGQSLVTGNTIAFNAVRGVYVSGTASGNTLSRNSLFGNGTIGIDLAGTIGPTANDSGDADGGPNEGQNYPELTSATIVGSVTIAGSIDSTPNSTFTTEFFIGPSCHSSGFGEGRTFLGEAVIATDDTGRGRFSITAPDDVAAGSVITATATNANGSTSEFSRCIAIASGQVPAGTVVSLLAPKTATLALGTAHTVTAAVTAGGAPLAGVPVDLEIVAGPNGGITGTVNTNAAGQASFTYASNGASGSDTIQASGSATGVQFATTAAVAWSATASATVVEFYNAALDHYFITWVPAEIAILDAGVETKGWTRTNQTLRTYISPQTGTSPVCRFYIPPNLGDSHFFGRGTTECNATAQNNPSFTLEDPQFMHLFLPVQGVCPANTTPVYRVFSNRPDANHRYMTDRAIRDQMVARGWQAEGDGPDLVVMCQPV